MKKFEGNLIEGMKLIYDGATIRWCNSKGVINETMKPGKYIISRITYKYIYVAADRKNSATEHQINKEELLNGLYELEFEDMTTSLGVLGINVFNHKNWYINNEELINKAKKYNKNR